MTLNIRTSPPFNRLPSEDDLSDLPVWGVAAILARIAERIEPVIISSFSHYPKTDLDFIRRARVWAAKSASSAGNVPALKDLQSHSLLHGVAEVILDVVAYVFDANQGKTLHPGHSIIDTARFATLRLMDFPDELSASALIDGVLQDIGTLREQHVENIANPHRAIRPAELGDLWPSGEPVRVFEARLRLFLHKQRIDAHKQYFQHEYDSGYSWSILFGLPRYAALAFCIRALWSLDHLIGKRFGKSQPKELDPIRGIIEELRRRCSSGTPVAYPEIKDAEQVFRLTKPQTLTRRTDKGEILRALFKCATYHLLVPGENLKATFETMGRSIGVVLLSLQYDDSAGAMTIRKEVDQDFSDILELSRRMPWNDDTGIDPAELARLRKDKNAETRLIPLRTDVEREIWRYNRRYGEYGARLPKRCVFCGQPPTSETEEHVIPKWLMKMTGGSGRFVTLPGHGANENKGPFASYKFPACDVCNDRYGRELENSIRSIFLRLCEGETTCHDEISLVLDWLDKVRIGTWVGELMSPSNAYRVVPNFHIQDRIATTDRLCIIGRCASAPKNLTFGPCNDPLFVQVPSFFWLCANNIAMVSVSSIGVASRLLGVPFLVQMSDMPDGRIQAKWAPSLKLPVKKRLPFVDHRFVVFAQTILPERPVGDNPYRAEMDRFLEKDSKRSRIHVVADGHISRLEEGTPFQLTSKVEEWHRLQLINRAVSDEARRWVLYSSPPPPLTDDDKLSRDARRHHFDRLKLAELGHSCCRLD